MGFSEKLGNYATRISELWIVKCIRNGLLYMLPVTLLGAFSVLILNFPIPQFQNFMNNTFGEHWRNFLLSAYRGTFSIISITAFFSISYQLCNTSKSLLKDQIPPLAIVLISFATYCTIIGNPSTSPSMFTNDMLNVNGLFNAIIFSVLIVSVFIFFYKHRLFKMKLYSEKSEIIFEKSMKILEPAFFTLLTFSIFRMILNYFQIYDFNISNLISFIFAQGKISSIFLYNFISHGLWFFGIHGNHVVESAASSIFEGATIFNKNFLALFVFLGGSGASLCLIIALICTNIKKSPKIAKFSLIPAIFNVNETIVYGLPVVLNPFLLIPFILVPIVLTITSYFAFYWGFVPPIVYTELTWTTPIFIGGFVSTLSINGTILQAINLFIGTLIYIPFVRLYNNYKETINKKHFSDFIDKVLNTNSANVLSANDEIGTTARFLINDILDDFNNNAKNFYLEFQPQVNNIEQVVGIEALLRFNHSTYGMIPPPVVVELMHESGYEYKLGYWIIETAIKTLQELNKKNIDLILSINLSGNQLNDKKLIPFISDSINKYKINPMKLKFELLENEDILDTTQNKHILQQIQLLGCKIAIDDFGMGHSSLMYVKRFNIDTIKIDGILIKDISTNVESQRIVESICKLAKDLDISVIAEFVETKEQKDLLLSLNCYIFQGYYYSKPIGFKELVNYVKKINSSQ